ncbi:MAG: hypothetical protein L0K41_09995 [Yaniella sp.]|nr:hypothetical protein [Yaniella sp.]
MADSTPPPAEFQEPQADTPQQMVLRRAPKITPFLVSGAVRGFVVAVFWVAIMGGTQEYSQTQTLSFFAAIFAIVGLAISALWWMVIDRRSKRAMETVYARPTEDPETADVALTQDDYAQWSHFQQNERLEQARREQFAQAKADAKAKKHSKRK